MKALYLFVVVIPPPRYFCIGRAFHVAFYYSPCFHECDISLMFHLNYHLSQKSYDCEYAACFFWQLAHFTSCSILLPCGLNLFIHIFHMLGNVCSYLYDVQIFSIWSTLVEQEYIVPLAQYCIRLYFSRGLRCDKSKDIHVCYAFSFPFCHDSMVITDSKADVISSGVARDNSLLLMTPLEVFSLSRRKGFILRLWKIFI